MRKARKYPPNPRLVAARKRFHSTATEAAKALGIPVPTYSAHENGSNRMSVDNAILYAKRFGSTPGWLLFGEGEEFSSYKVQGHVGAGADVDWEDDAKIEDTDVVLAPPVDEARALIVKGDSQYPRFLDGEVVLFERESTVPSKLIGQYAIVQLADGRRLIKILRRSPKGGERFALESHNATTMDDAQVEFAWRYLGTIHPRSPGKIAPPRSGTVR